MPVRKPCGSERCLVVAASENFIEIHIIHETRKITIKVLRGGEYVLDTSLRQKGIPPRTYENLARGTNLGKFILDKITKK